MSSTFDNAQRAQKELPLVPSGFVCDSLRADSPIELTSSWLAVNLYRGCSFGCTYCFRYRWHPHDEPTVAIPIAEAFDELIKHPSFVPDRTPITANVSSTDPLHPKVRESTVRFAEMLDSHGLSNPYGIVSKGFLSKQMAKRLTKLRTLRPVLLASYSAMPTSIEPIPVKRRIAAMENAQGAGLPIIIQYKPIVKNWNDSDHQIRDVMAVSSRYAAAIVLGGLRLDAAIGKAIVDGGRELPFPIPDSWGDKILAPDLKVRIDNIHEEICPSTPVYDHTSCAVSLVMGIRNYNALRVTSPNSCSSTCPSHQIALCDK